MIFKLLTTSLIASGLVAALPATSLPRATLPLIDCDQIQGDAILEWFNIRNVAFNHDTNMVSLDLNVWAFPNGGYDSRCTATVTPSGLVFDACDNGAIPTTMAFTSTGMTSNRIAFNQQFACKSPNGGAPVPTVVESNHDISSFLCWNGNVQFLCFGRLALPGTQHPL